MGFESSPTEFETRGQAAASGNEQAAKLRRMSQHVEGEENEGGESEIPEDDGLAEEAASDPVSDEANAPTEPRHSDPEPDTGADDAV